MILRHFLINHRILKEIQTSPIKTSQVERFRRIENKTQPVENSHGIVTDLQISTTS